MSDLAKLEPCPFCDGRSEVIDVPPHHPRWKKSHRPQCVTCGASLGEFDKSSDATTAWNTRPLSAPDARRAAEEIEASMYECCGCPAQEPVFDQSGGAVIGGTEECCGKPKFIGPDKEKIAAIIGRTLSELQAVIARQKAAITVQLHEQLDTDCKLQDMAWSRDAAASDGYRRGLEAAAKVCVYDATRRQNIADGAANNKARDWHLAGVVTATKLAKTIRALPPAPEAEKVDCHPPSPPASPPSAPAPTPTAVREVGGER